MPDPHTMSTNNTTKDLNGANSSNYNNNDGAISSANLDNLRRQSQPPPPNQSNRLVQPDEIPVYIQRSTFEFNDFLHFFTPREPARFNQSKPHVLSVGMPRNAQFTQQMHHNQQSQQSPSAQSGQSAQTAQSAQSTQATHTTHTGLSDDAWAALKLRVDPLARQILDPHRSYVAALFMSTLILLVFWAIKPGFDKEKIKNINNGNGKKHNNHNGDYYDDNVKKKEMADDIYFDDYIHDDEYERIHNPTDDVIIAELNYLNSTPELDHALFVWRIGLAFSLCVLLGSVIVIAVLMEQRNGRVDVRIGEAIEEIRERVEGEGIGVEYRTSRMTHVGHVGHSHQSNQSDFGDGNGGNHRQTGGKGCGRRIQWTFWSRYIRPTRVVVFRYLEEEEMREKGIIHSSSFREGSISSYSAYSALGGARSGQKLGGDGTNSVGSRTRSFFSEDYQRRYFPPSRMIRSTPRASVREDTDELTISSSTFSAMLS